MSDQQLGQALLAAAVVYRAVQVLNEAYPTLDLDKVMQDIDNMDTKAQLELLWTNGMYKTWNTQITYN